MRSGLNPNATEPRRAITRRTDGDRPVDPTKQGGGRARDASSIVNVVEDTPCAWSKQLFSRSSSRRRGRLTVGRCSCCTAGPTRRAVGGRSQGGCTRVAGARSCRRCAAPAPPVSARRTRRETDAASRSPPTRSKGRAHDRPTPPGDSGAMNGAAPSAKMGSAVLGKRVVCTSLSRA